jgi:hypothetical protein
LRDRDALLLQKRGHRRVDIVVLTGDGKAAVAHCSGNRSHRSAADAEKMDVLERMIHGMQKLSAIPIA